MNVRLASVFSWFFGLATVLLLSGCGGPTLMDRWDTPFGFGCCGLIILVMDIIAVIEVLGSRRSLLGKLFWIILIVAFPVLGFFLYFFFADRT